MNDFNRVNYQSYNIEHEISGRLKKAIFAAYFWSMSLYSALAEQLQYISPDFYKRRFFKKLHGLDAENIFERKVEPELLWIADFLPDSAVFMDIGANVGAYIYILQKRLQPENIIAFEPNPQLFARLIRIFPKIRAFNIALSDKKSSAEFKVPIIKGKKIHSRGTLEQRREQGETSSKTFKVQVETLDDFVAGLAFRHLDFIKMDVEGHELSALRGARKTIEKFRPVLMVEIEQRHHDFPVWDIINEVSDWGYSPKYLCRETFSLKDLSQEIIVNQDESRVKSYADYINNIIFLPKI